MSVAPVEDVENKIITIRRKKVMLDKDLADGFKPTRLREQVKRNRKRFPAEFNY